MTGDEVDAATEAVVNSYLAWKQPPVGEPEFLVAFDQIFDCAPNPDCPEEIYCDAE